MFFLKKNKKLVAMFLLPLICSIYAIFFIPQIFNIATKNTTQYGFTLVFGTIIGLFAILFLSTFLFYVKNEKNSPKLSFGSAFVRLLFTMFSLCLCTIVLSLIFGIISVLLNLILKNFLYFEQIKGVINFMVTGLTVMVMPIFVSIFWHEARGKDTLIKSFISGIFVKRKIYIKLLVLILVLYAIGVLIMTAFNYLGDGIIINFFKVILMSLTGMLGLRISEKLV